MKSRTGLFLAGIYLLIVGILVYSQGLFGESFIALLLGLPWSMLFSFFEFGGVSGAMLYVLVLAPIALNAAILYWIGSRIGRKSKSM